MDRAEQYDDFMRWQCRLRMHAMRELGGRPSAGMTAGIHSVNGGDEQARINFLIVRKDSAARTVEFQHIVRKTPDSSEWLKHGLRILSERHYQQAGDFDNELTALFSLDSQAAYALLKAGQCRLSFAEGSVAHEFDFDVRSLNQDEELFAATYWHNHLFNPALPGGVRVLGFSPRLS